MSELPPKLTKWPFLLGDALLVGLGCYFCLHTATMGWADMAFVAGCFAVGAVLAVAPFILEYRALVKVTEAEALTRVVSKVQNIESVAAQISGATGQWQNVQQEAGKTVAAARGIAEKMSAEAQSFTEFMQKMNDSEKATLRLEVDKLRRAEGDWLQILVRMLDHVYGLYVGGVRSGQPSLIEQLGHFQSTCRDAARRIGLVPYEVEPGTPFDSEKHQLIEGEGAASNGAVVQETIATGYTFQSRLLRPALVRVTQPAEVAPVAGEGQAGPV